MQAIEQRIRQVETLLGAPLPGDCLELLRKPISGSMAVQMHGELCELSFFYELSDGNPLRQLDGTYQRVHDVLPPYALPIATDPGGNFFCLFINGPKEGEVVFWDHERDLGDYETERISESLGSFLASIQRKDDD